MIDSIEELITERVDLMPRSEVKTDLGILEKNIVRSGTEMHKFLKELMDSEEGFVFARSNTQKLTNIFFPYIEKSDKGKVTREINKVGTIPTTDFEAELRDILGGYELSYKSGNVEDSKKLGSLLDEKNIIFSHERARDKIRAQGLISKNIFDNRKNNLEVKYNLVCVFNNDGSATWAIKTYKPEKSPQE